MRIDWPCPQHLARHIRPRAKIHQASDRAAREEKAAPMSRRQSLSSIMWLIVLAGPLVNTVLLSMSDMERHVYIVITGVLTVFLGMVIFLFAAMDFPYRGDVSISPEAFEQVYATVMSPGP
jgi:protein-S-isoprenylcysteine O-methyltransferase Ste14